MANNPYTKLISVRLDKETLAAINDFNEGRNYWNRSSTINLALRQLFVHCTKEQIFEFLYSKNPLN